MVREDIAPLACQPNTRLVDETTNVASVRQQPHQASTESQGINMEMVAKIRPEGYFRAQLTCCSHLTKTIETLHKRLTHTQLDMFRQTIFGPIVDSNIIFNGQLIHHLLLREVEDPRQDVISFNIFGNRVSFGKQEFDLITGFRHHRRTFDRNKSGVRLRRLYFKDSVKDTVADAEKRFLEIQFETDEDAVKVALAYFIELAMFGRERKQKFNWFLLGIVDDWEIFCNYDWSKVIFEMTIRSLKKALRAATQRDDVVGETGRVERYNLYGFPHAFQVWAYETISSLTNRVANQLNQDAIPRFSRWSCSHSPSYTQLSNEIFGLTEAKVIVQLVSSDAELEHMRRIVGAPEVSVLSPQSEAPIFLPQPELVNNANVDPVVSDRGSDEAGWDRGSPIKEADMVGLDEELTHESLSEGVGKTCRCDCKHSYESLDRQMKEIKNDLKEMKVDLKSIKKYLRRLSKGKMVVDPTKYLGPDHGAVGDEL